MKKYVITAAVFAACLALCAAVWPQIETAEERRGAGPYHPEKPHRGTDSARIQLQTHAHLQRAGA